MEATGPAVRCNKPCRAEGSAGSEAARPFRDSGQPRPYEGRNPLSETTEVTADVTSGGATAEAAVAERAGTTRRRRAGGGLASMLLPELQSLAASLGISGTARMRKGELVTAIQERQAATAARSEVAAAPRTESPKDERPKGGRTLLPACFA
ncbi:hypothetical protein GCM10009557_90370 [Virgisporangium ochraceum]